MAVDVLKEMYSKRDAKGSEYSNQLKAFALMIHFKQPTAFFRLGELFEGGWPPLSVIKVRLTTPISFFLSFFFQLRIFPDLKRFPGLEEATE